MRGAGTIVLGWRAAHHLEAASDDIELVESEARVRGTPTAAISLARIAELAYFKPAKLPPGVPTGLEASGRYRAASPMILSPPLS